MHKHLTLRILLVVLLGLVSSGCNKGPKFGAVSGKVTYKTKALNVGRISFYSEALGAGAACDLDDQGNYKMDPPVPVGVYKVAFVDGMMPASLRVQDQEKTIVDSKYKNSETSGFTVEIKEGNAEKNFDIP